MALAVDGEESRMGPRHILIGSFSLISLAASAAAQPQPNAPKAAPPAKTARPAKIAKASGVNVPHTLAEALAATYANQPALQAERAKLRATDENVPTALAGWRPTVVLTGTAGYGDGTSRQYLATSAFPLNVKSQTDRMIGTAQ